MTLPNFFIAGVPKAGSTSLHRYLRQHPQIYLNPIKEPMFFATPDLLAREGRFSTPSRDQRALRAYLAGAQVEPAQFWVTEWEDYLAMFRNVSDEVAIGDASVTYFWTPSAGPAIRAAVPEAKLIFVLRDPADRSFSWYLVKQRHEPRPELTFREWFRRTAAGGPDRGAVVDAGRYATQLQRFLDLFPRDQIRVYLYRDFRADTRAVLRDMFRFLGVDPDFPVDVSRRHNVTVTPRFPRLDRLRTWARWLPATARRTLRRMYLRPRGRLAPDPDDRRMVIDFYRDEILRTGDIIGRDLTAWLR